MLYKNLEGYYTLIGAKVKAELEQVAFDLALNEFNLHNYNIVKVSSILPKGFRYSERLEKLPEEGEVLYMAYIWHYFRKEDILKHFDETFSAGVLVVESQNVNQVGLILEASGFYDKTTLREMLLKNANLLLRKRTGFKPKEMRFEIVETKFIEKKDNYFVFEPFGVLVGVVLW